MDVKLINTLLLQKLTAFVLVFLAFLYIRSGYNFMYFAIVLGHSHFVLAYFYKIMSRKIKLKNFLMFAALSISLFIYFYRIDFPDFRIESLLLITTIYAIYHTIADDQFTLNFFSPNYSKTQKLQMLTLISALTGLHVSWQFNFQYSWVLIAASLFLFAAILDEKNKEKLAWTNADFFFLFQYAFTCIIFVSGMRFDMDRFLIISFIGVYHYLVYYFHYYSKIKSIEAKTTSILHKRHGYLMFVGLSNALIAGLFFFNYANPGAVLTHFFSYNLFLILTLMHFISSTRTHEIPALFNFKKS